MTRRSTQKHNPRPLERRVRREEEELATALAFGSLDLSESITPDNFTRYLNSKIENNRIIPTLINNQKFLLRICLNYLDDLVSIENIYTKDSPEYSKQLEKTINAIKPNLKEILEASVQTLSHPAHVVRSQTNQID